LFPLSPPKIGFFGSAIGYDEKSLQDFLCGPPRLGALLRLTKRLAKRGRSFETTEGTELILPILCIHVQKNIREM